MSLRAALATILIGLYPAGASGRKRWINIVEKWFPGAHLATGLYGARYLLDPKNYIDSRLLRDGIYEGALVEFFCREARERGCSLFIDVGANIGVYAVNVLARTAIKKVVAFEPDVRNRNQLSATIFLNALDDAVEIHSAALSDKDSNGILYAQRDRDHFSTAQSSLEPLTSTSVAMPVRLARLDSLMATKGEAVAIKIDVEGHEASALRGMARFLSENRIFLQIEIFERNLESVLPVLAALGLRELPRYAPETHDYHFVNY